MSAETTDPDAATPRKRSALRPLLVGLVLALLLGGGGFYAVWSGMLLGPADEHAEDEEPAAAAGPEVTFLPLEPIVVSLGAAAGSRYLRFRGELEVDPAQQAAVTQMMPRILDTLNGFLRAVSVRELQDPAALILLRAQMLRRIQIIVGEGVVNDLLIVEFVLS